MEDAFGVLFVYVIAPTFMGYGSIKNMIDLGKLSQLLSARLGRIIVLT